MSVPGKMHSFFVPGISLIGVARAHADQGNARNKKTVHLARNRHVQSLPSKRDVKKKPRLDAPTGGAVSGATAAIRRHQGTLSA